jgi:hypothetical protein
MGILDSIGNTLFGTAGSAFSDAQRRQGGINQAYQSGVQGSLQPFQQMANPQMATGIFSDYIQSLQSANPSQFAVNAPSMGYGDPLANVNRFLDPSIQAQMDASAQQTQASAAGRGGLFSGAAGNEIALNTRRIAEHGFGDAYNRSVADEAARRGVTQQNFQNQLQGGMFNQGLQQQGLANQGQAYQTAMQPINTMAQGNIDLQNTLFGAQSGFNQMGMQGQFADRGIFGDLLGAGSNLLGAYLGGK